MPRTFIGALLISGFVTPFIFIQNIFFGKLTKPHIQILVRGALGIYNSLSIIIFRYKISKHYNSSISLWYGILQVSQFHIIYYASRTLPNTFAFGLCTIATTYFMSYKRNDVLKGLFILSFTAVIFRLEIIILILSYALYFWFFNIITIQEIIKKCIYGGVLGLFCTVMIDSWFWKKYLLWPEGIAFYFNVIQGKSSEWGVSSWYTYFLNYIPRLLLNPLFIVLWVIALYTYKKNAINLLIPNIIFVFIYSFQPHKEWRFIVYVIPSLTLLSAIGAAWICKRRYKSLKFTIMFIILITIVLITFFVSIIMLLISSLNYPGGWALKIFNDQNLSEKKVYLDPYTCMTGASLFFQYNENIIYDRTENITKLNDFNYLKTIDWAIIGVSEPKLKGNWDTKFIVPGYSKVEKVYFNSTNNIITKLWYPRVKIENKILILKNNKN